ncbi:DNA gyrase inhibitor YacG [Kiloniella sp. b19]|uniref:DNA gyrase inhibitor YacG n=1 Tax=Kiloniella sp. GXU_MW_B19 TaxID=3141326 RepID=UPI0031D5993C
MNADAKKNDSAVPGCTLCGKPVQAKYKPFCSSRCADVDLNRWLSESYRIPKPLHEADPEELEEVIAALDGEGDSTLQ